jgi:diamine N-acetyltransferase
MLTDHVAAVHFRHSKEDAMTVTLRPVSRENWRAVAHLEVAENQRQLVAPNSYSLAEATYEPGLTPVAIYAGETVVGFALYTHEPVQGEWTLTCAPYRGELGILRMMLGRQHQRQGFGRQAMRALIHQMSQLPGGQAIILNFLPENFGARRLYESLGFVVYEQNEHGYWARLSVASPAAISAAEATAAS